ncbi:uncharacterized protein K489DRAFT_380293, partial [Dissoconium aciculare CBS 342.82]|uniref:Uncharacterized protein n=1 Tax=Dissoconium aciculare CBS 342.82 TaxID=1314786 RepID=A0A6J3M4T7_9PEZI
MSSVICSSRLAVLWKVRIRQICLCCTLSRRFNISAERGSRRQCLICLLKIWNTTWKVSRFRSTDCEDSTRRCAKRLRRRTGVNALECSQTATATHRDPWADCHVCITRAGRDPRSEFDSAEILCSPRRAQCAGTAKILPQSSFKFNDPANLMMRAIIGAGFTSAPKSQICCNNDHAEFGDFAWLQWHVFSSCRRSRVVRRQIL